LLGAGRGLLRSAEHQVLKEHNSHRFKIKEKWITNNEKKSEKWERPQWWHPDK